MDEIKHMSHTLRLATIATIVSIENPDINIDNWIKKEQFFEGYAKELVEYRQRKMGYKEPSKDPDEIAKRLASLGVPAHQVADLIAKKQKQAQEPEEPVKKLILPAKLTPVRGVSRM